MTEADEQLPENPEPPKTRTVQLPSRDQVTSVQVHTLLNAAQVLNQLLYPRGDEDESGGPKDGGVVSAVETTLLKICAQLDNIFDDAPRWKLGHQNGLEKQLASVYKAHLELLRTQREATIAVSSPHRIAGPKLFKMANSKWAAILGDGNKWDQCIVGVGDSPAAALADFDQVFNGLVQQQQKINEKATVDGGADSGPEKLPGVGPDLRGDRSATGSDSGELPPEV